MENEISSQYSASKSLEQFNFRQFFILIHFFMFEIYLFTKESSFYQSYHSQKPLFFYLLLIIYCIMLKYYAKSCESPGYANDELIDIQKSQQNHFFCKHCQIYVPLRASHCNICQKCILRRDHHCKYTNICIGRDNHFYFFIFTLFAFISDIFPLLDALFHLIFRYLIIVQNKGFIIIVLCYISFIFATLTASLLTYSVAYQCIISISNNSTLWERSKWERISYLKNFPKNISPFDKGLMNNFIEFCTMRRNKMKWEIETTKNSEVL